MKRIIIIVSIFLLVSCGFATYMFQKSSYRKKEVVRDSACLSFLSECKYIKENVQVTSYKPLNAVNVSIAIGVLVSLLIVISLLSLGDNGLNWNGRILFLNISLVALGVFYTGLVVYGSNAYKKEIVLGGLSIDEDTCLRSVSDALDFGDEPNCQGDAANKAVGDFWRD